MKKKFSHIFLLLILFTSVASCFKESASEGFYPFYELTVNGSNKSVAACGTSDHVAQYLKDTAVFAAFGCGGQKAGFYLKGSITQGTYQLDHKNQAWYDQESMLYTTDSSHKGSLTVRTGYYQADGSSIPYMEGEVSFNAIDKNSGKTIKVTNGKYLLKKHQY